MNIIINELIIPEEMKLLINMTEEQAIKFLETEEIRYPTSREKIIAQTGWIGEMILTFIQERYPHRYSTMMLSERMLQFVQKRTEEVKEYIMEIEDNYIEANPVNNPQNPMELIQLKNKAREIAVEMAKEEVIYCNLVI